MQNIPDSLLKPARISQIRIDLTSRCNLRCVYCAVSQPEYQGRDMPREIVSRIVENIRSIAPYHTLAPIDMNGHGETTYVEGWHEICEDLLLAGEQLRMTSNFAKDFSIRELEILACMRAISISIDTSDRALLRRMRRKVDVRQIVTNMQMVRATAIRLHRRPPAFRFLSGLYDLNAPLIEEFARFAIAMQVESVGFWSLTPYPMQRTEVDEADWPLPLDNLDDSILRPLLEQFRHATALMRRNGIEVEDQGGFVERLCQRVGL